MAPQTSNDVNYILFTHLPNKDEAWQTFDQVIDGQTGAEALGKCLSRKSAPGILVVFVEAGWLSLLNTIGTDFNPVEMATEFSALERIEEKVKNMISKCPSLEARFRLVSAKTLYPILNNLRGNKPGLEAVRLKDFLVGKVSGVRYDTTKVVEAIIRVRHLGSGIPVLRVDWDALLNHVTLSKHYLDTLSSTLLGYCDELEANHQVHSYFISGAYVQPSTKPTQWSINDFNTAYATRMFPALVPTNKAITLLNKNTIKDSKNNSVDGPWPATTSEAEVYLCKLANAGLFDNGIMTAYYDYLPSFGSDPNNSVISGAGLVISEGAILDLPPFSNFRQNVMWIDDYLKYELHRALGHFSEVKTLVSPSVCAVPARHPDVQVYKDRILAGQGNLRPYTLGIYLPTLLWGILVDAWIRGEPPSLHERSPFVRHLERALECGVFDNPERNELRQALQVIAVKRINRLIDSWSNLATLSGDKSFAAIWVRGARSEMDCVMNGLSPPDDNWLGWGLLKAPTTAISELRELRDPIQKIVVQLINDICTYIDWTLDWPKFIQSVRAVKTGSLALDVSYTS